MVTATEKLGLIGTRIVDFRVSPSRVAVGEAVTIAGTLQVHTPVLCWWGGWEGVALEVLADTVKLGDVTSGSGGGFRFIWAPTEKGTYWIKARYGGDWLHNGCESPTLSVEVVSKEEREAEEMRFWTLVGVGSTIALVAIVAGVYIYTEQERIRIMRR